MLTDDIKIRLVECANSLFFEKFDKPFSETLCTKGSETLWTQMETDSPFVAEALAVFGEILSIRFL